MYRRLRGVERASATLTFGAQYREFKRVGTGTVRLSSLAWSLVNRGASPARAITLSGLVLSRGIRNGLEARAATTYEEPVRHQVKCRSGVAACPRARRLIHWLSHGVAGEAR